MYSMPFQMAHALTKILMGAWLWGAAHAAVTITAPSEGLQVLAGRTFTVEWTGTSVQSNVEIDLYYYGSMRNNSDFCGDWVAALCDYGANGDGGCSPRQQEEEAVTGGSEFDVVLPEPHFGYSEDSSQYKVRVRSSADLDNIGCSDAFTLLPSAEAPHPGQPEGGGPFLEVFSPQDNDGAIAGEEYTVEFAYDNGLGSSTDRFKIDLYRADVGEGDCGKWITSICDKHEVGCKDSKGDYDVEIPAGAPPGAYRIRVGRFEDDSLFACSGRFHIMHDLSDYDHNYDDDGDDDSGKTADEGDRASSYSFSVSFDDDNTLGGGGGGGGGGPALGDDDWWMATNLGDDDAPPPPPPAKGGGGLWGDDDGDERQEEDGREEHASTGGGGGGGSPYSFSYDFVWATDDWYN